MLAQEFYRRYAHLELEELLERLDDAKNQIINYVETYDNDKLYAKPWYRSYTMGRMIQLNTSSPYKNARKRLRRWFLQNFK